MVYRLWVGNQGSHCLSALRTNRYSVWYLWGTKLARIRVGCVVNDTYNRGGFILLWVSDRGSILQLHGWLGSTPPGLSSAHSPLPPVPRLWMLTEAASVSPLPPGILILSPGPPWSHLKTQQVPTTQVVNSLRISCLLSVCPQLSTFMSCQWSVLWVLPCVRCPSCLMFTVRKLREVNLHRITAIISHGQDFESHVLTLRLQKTWWNPA